MANCPSLRLIGAYQIIFIRVLSIQLAINYIRSPNQLLFWNHRLILVVCKIDAEARKVIITGVFKVFIVKGPCMARSM